MPPWKEVFENWDQDVVDALELIPQTGLGISEEEREELRGILRAQLEQLENVESAGQADEEQKLWRQRRGLRLERVLFMLLALEGLSPSASYVNNHRPALSCEICGGKLQCAKCTKPKRGKRGRVPGSEQIDGFFELGSRYFLVEAKWEAGPVPASVIYEFRGKVEGKLAGTFGVIMSIPGFAEDIEFGLAWGKGINVILADGSDLKNALAPGGSFAKMLEVKLREAARRGVPYYRYSDYLDSRTNTVDTQDI